MRCARPRRPIWTTASACWPSTTTRTLLHAADRAGPCQPINCTEDTFTETIRLARSAGVHMHTHLCEGENSSMVRRFGVRSLEWCRRIGFTGSDIWLAHGRETLPEEYPLLAESGMGISPLPRPPPCWAAARYWTSPACGRQAFPWVWRGRLRHQRRLQYAGHPASGIPDADVPQQAAGGCPSPYDMLKLATAGGADMIGRPELGRLAVGKAADLFMVDVRRLEYAGALHDPASMLAKLGVTGPCLAHHDQWPRCLSE